SSMRCGARPTEACGIRSDAPYLSGVAFEEWNDGNYLAALISDLEHAFRCLQVPVAGLVPDDLAAGDFGVLDSCIERVEFDAFTVKLDTVVRPDVKIEPWHISIPSG